MRAWREGSCACVPAWGGRRVQGPLVLIHSCGLSPCSRAAPASLADPALPSPLLHSPALRHRSPTFLPSPPTLPPRQVVHHGDKPSEVTQGSFRNFLIDSPLIHQGPEQCPQGAPGPGPRPRKRPAAQAELRQVPLGGVGRCVLPLPACQGAACDRPPPAPPLQAAAPQPALDRSTSSTGWMVGGNAHACHACSACWPGACDVTAHWCTPPPGLPAPPCSRCCLHAASRLPDSLRPPPLPLLLPTGVLVAVGVVDVLPRCLSSKYLFWDPGEPIAVDCFHWLLWLFPAGAAPLPTPAGCRACPACRAAHVAARPRLAAARQA